MIIYARKGKEGEEEFVCGGLMLIPTAKHKVKDPTMTMKPLVVKKKGRVWKLIHELKLSSGMLSEVYSQGKSIEVINDNDHIYT